MLDKATYLLRHGRLGCHWQRSSLHQRGRSGVALAAVPVGRTLLQLPWRRQQRAYTQGGTRLVVRVPPKLTWHALTKSGKACQRGVGGRSFESMRNASTLKHRTCRGRRAACRCFQPLLGFRGRASRGARTLFGKLLHVFSGMRPLEFDCSEELQTKASQSWLWCRANGSWCRWLERRIVQLGPRARLNFDSWPFMQGRATQDESPSCHAVLQASFCWCSGPQAQSAATVSAFTRHHLVAPRSRGGTTRRSKQSPPTNFMVVCCPSLSKSVAWHARLPRSGHGYLGRTLTSEPCFPLPSQASTSPRAAKRYSLDLLLEIKADSHAILSSRRP